MLGYWAAHLIWYAQGAVEQDRLMGLAYPPRCSGLSLDPILIVDDGSPPCSGFGPFLCSLSLSLRPNPLGGSSVTAIMRVPSIRSNA
jgi:hypothetical protein